MRRMILTSLVLFPVMAHAAAKTSTELQPSGSSVAVQAELSQPTGLAMAIKASKKAAAGTIPAISLEDHATVRELVRTEMTENATDAAIRQGGVLEYGMSGTPVAESTAPKITQAIAIDLSTQELAEQPAVSKVELHATVDAYGYPRNLTVTKSAGSVVDKKALAAVSHYQYTPAMVGNKPVDAAVTISIEIEKP